MNNPLLNAFFIGRATAEVLSETLEHRFTDVLSSISRFDAEQREQMRQFIQQVLERAEFDATRAQTQSTPNSSPSTASSPSDLQETIDELRAEIAQLRSALQVYRQRSGL
jgi:tripartite-type tricarboxylate transporter receptor subunit TctC